jgi:hypothetical protein
MEYEIDESSEALWFAHDPLEADPNHMPGWFGDSAGTGQTGEWIPEESRPVTARSLEPAD